MPKVSGHAGDLIFGKFGDTPVLALSGRAHFYEGYSMEQVTFPIRTLAAFGIRDLLLTNAAGGINQKFRPGDFMVVTDHINLMGANPLRGPANSGLNQFVDLTDTYDKGLRALLVRAGKSAACGCIAVFIWRSADRLMKRRPKSARSPGWVPTRSG